MRYLIILLFVILSLFVQAQENRKSNSTSTDQDKTKYEENVFNKELGENDVKQDKQRQFDLIPEKLPDWFFEPILLNPVRIIGISDPGLEKAEAYNQAIIRAKAIYALINFSSVSNISDDYTNLRESYDNKLFETKFQDFTTSKATISYNNSGILIADTFYTKYNEGIVLIEITNQNEDVNMDTIEVRGEQLQIVTERSYKNEKIEFFNLFINDSKQVFDSIPAIAQYNFRRVNKNFDISSIYGSGNYDFPERSYNYLSAIDFVKDSTDTEFQANTLALGLWNAYLCGILNNITNLSKQLASQIKNSNDYYTLKNEGLIRTVARNKVHFEINKFKIIQNQIYIDLYGEIRQ